MNKVAWGILCGIGAVASLAIVVVSAVLGGCEMQMELASGALAPMKCHWSFVADTFVGAIGVVAALVALSCKDQSGRRASGIVLVAVAIVAALIPSSAGIGLCGDASMHCHGTAHIVWALSAIAALVGIVQVVKSRV